MLRQTPPRDSADRIAGISDAVTRPCGRSRPRGQADSPAGVRGRAAASAGMRLRARPPMLRASSPATPAMHQPRLMPNLASHPGSTALVSSRPALQGGAAARRRRGPAARSRRPAQPRGRIWNDDLEEWVGWGH